MASLGGKASTSSSSPCQTDGLDKSLCFWGFKFGVKKTEWYVFNLSSNDFSYKNEKKKRKLKEDERKRLQLHYGIEIVPARPIHHHHYGDNRIGMGTLRPISVTHGLDIDSCVIAVGSVVYRIGGHSGEKELRVVRCFDITCPENGWTEGPPMLCPRYEPRAVVLSGKIYVMGGTSRHSYDRSGPWAEVFDPCLNKWQPIPPPPSRQDFISLAAFDASKRIHLYFDKSKVSYDVMTESWEEPTHELGIYSARCSSQPTVVGDTVYWFEAYGTKLYAYDFNLKKAFHCWIKGLNDEGEIKRSLHHLGGDVFCLVWVEIDDDDDEKPNLMRCHCLKFQVSKSFESSKIVGQDYQLNVSLKSCQSYHVDDRIEFLDSLLLVNNSVPKKLLNRAGEISSLEPIRPPMPYFINIPPPPRQERTSYPSMDSQRMGTLVPFQYGPSNWATGSCENKTGEKQQEGQHYAHLVMPPPQGQFQQQFYPPSGYMPPQLPPPPYQQLPPPPYQQPPPSHHQQPLPLPPPHYQQPPPPSYLQPPPPPYSQLQPPPYQQQLPPPYQQLLPPPNFLPKNVKPE